MPRPRNEEQFNRITAEIFRQLLARGISGTSYASVAEAANSTRALVQDYYPRKSDMVNAFSRMAHKQCMEASRPFCNRLEIADEQTRKVGHLFLSGSLYFEFMQSTAERRRFFAEMLRDRDQAEMLISMVMARSFEEIGRADVVEDPAFRNDLIMSLGGFFELFYNYLKRGEHFDPELYYGQMTRIWMLDAGFTQAQVDEVLSRCSYVLDEVDVMLASLERALGDLLE